MTRTAVTLSQRASSAVTYVEEAVPGVDTRLLLGLLGGVVAGLLALLVALVRGRKS